MRELTMEELDLVAGGLQTYDGDGITIVDDGIGGDGDGDGADGWDGWWDGGYDGGGGGGGGSTDPQADYGPDQQARDAAQLFFQAAAAEGHDLAYRERAAFILRNDDGSYSLGPIAEGAPLSGSVSPNTSGVTPWNVVGMIQNQSDGSITPSASETTLITSYQNAIYDNGGTQEFRLYVVGGDGKIYVYDKDNMNNGPSNTEISGG